MSEICNLGPNERQARLELAGQASSGVNGIEYLEVLDRRMPGAIEAQQTLVVVCLKDLPDSGLAADNLTITGGVRVTDIPISWAYRGTAFYTSQTLPPPPPPGVPVQESNALWEVIRSRFWTRPKQILVVRTAVVGDASTYTLALSIGSTGPGRLPFDPLLSSVAFSFKIECPNDFDCHIERDCPTEDRPRPTIDYLAKDYDSFRALILDRLSVLMPDWTERNPADVGITLVELLAYAADQLSYYQDVVANEAYLGTSRFRTSVRRHARLLDYRLHEGSNARTWVQITRSESSSTANSGTTTIPAHTKLLSRRPLLKSTVVKPLQAQQEIDAGATVFETMADLELRSSSNELDFHLWGARSLVLRKGTTCATLRNPGGDLSRLKKGDVIAIVEKYSAQSGTAEEADPSKRHVVRLTQVPVPDYDPLFTDPNSTQPMQLLHIAWDVADALPFDLCIEQIQALLAGTPTTVVTAVVLGNIVLADHGESKPVEPLTPTARGSHQEAWLKYPSLTFQGHVRGSDGSWRLYDPTAPASAALKWDTGRVMPCISMQGAGPSSDGESWAPQFDLLESDSFANDFVVETEDDGTARVRFGDGINGRLPESTMLASYRVGNGAAGNIGQAMLAHIVLDVDDAAIGGVSNVTAAAGGSDPETIEHAILVAPQAFRTQERAVTEADYARAAERHPEVQRAVAMRRFVGSWNVFYVSVDRKGARPFDEAFRQTMLAFIEPYRLAGHDVEIREPEYVPLDIVLPVCVRKGHLRSQVLAQLQGVFRAFDLPGKPKGFFHPDLWTFGQPVYLSRVLAVAMSVPGVEAVLTSSGDKDFRFRRYLSTDTTAEQSGIIAIGISEIASVANDLNQPMNGEIAFVLRGGL